MTAITTEPITEEEAARYRSEFPIFQQTIYLNSCSLGPPSRAALDALQRYADDWSAYGAPAWGKVWMGQLNLARARFARLIGAQPHEVALSHSISSALSSVASTFDYQERRSVVCADLDFPTIPYQWLARARQGVEVRFAGSPDRMRVPLEAYEAVADDSLACIATTHVFYTSGYVQPIRQLADLAHSRGGRIVVDGYHSVGVLPVDVKVLDVDFYLGGTLKWLLGGPGLTFIYVREELIPHLEPAMSGWFASSNQFAFDARTLDWPETASRLQLGTPSVATAYAGVAGMDTVLEAGVERIYPRIQMLTDRIVERASQAGYGVVSPEDRAERGGIVMLRVQRPEETVNELLARGFTVDYRPGLVRVSPHFFNTADDIDRFMDELEAVQTQIG